MNLRVLFVGYIDEEIPQKNPSEEFDNVTYHKYDLNHWGTIDGKRVHFEYLYEKGIPTFYDYHIVFLKNPDEIFDRDGHWTNQNMKKTINEKRTEIRELLKLGGILCTFVFPKINDNYNWLSYSIPFSLTNRNGDTVVPTKSVFKKTIEKYSFCYFAHFEEDGYYLKETDDIIATNLHGVPISFYRKIDNGTIIFLPQPSPNETKSIFRDLIDIISKNFISKPERKSIPPTWLNNYTFPNENKYLKDIGEKKKIISEYSKVTGLLRFNMHNY